MYETNRCTSHMNVQLLESWVGTQLKFKAWVPRGYKSSFGISNTSVVASKGSMEPPFQGRQACTEKCILFGAARL